MQQDSVDITELITRYETQVGKLVTDNLILQMRIESLERTLEEVDAPNKEKLPAS